MYITHNIHTEAYLRGHTPLHPLAQTHICTRTHTQSNMHTHAHAHACANICTHTACKQAYLHTSTHTRCMIHLTWFVPPNNKKLTFKRVVIANVAMLLLTSVIKFSKSKLQVITDCGCIIATLFNVLTAANRSVGLGELRNNCKTK